MTFQNGGTCIQKWGKESVWKASFSITLNNGHCSLISLNMCATCSGLGLLFFGLFESYNIRCIRVASLTVNSLRLSFFKILLLWPVQAVKPFHKHFIQCNPPKINLNLYASVLNCQICPNLRLWTIQKIIYPNQIYTVYGIRGYCPVP